MRATKNKRNRLVSELAAHLCVDYGSTLMESGVDIEMAIGVLNLLKSKINFEKVKPMTNSEFQLWLKERVINAFGEDSLEGVLNEFRPLLNEI